MQNSTTYPITGTNSVYSSTRDFFIINVPKVSGGSVFDPVNSYLHFNLNMPANASGSIQGDVTTIFQRVEVFCGSELLESINNYDQICSMFFVCQVSPIDRVYGWNCTKGTCDYSVSAANASQIYTGQNLSGIGTAATSRFYQHTFVSGVVGCLATHLIPTFAIADPILLIPH